ncbi:CsbD family protein [Caenimonas sedimenti]|uniref:CsbD family protein n=1 Tax=Caenimonas sedimenti TaxID=2596921 RepID=A0A562ZT69_9BURK|nr:CsbD family protein [Caenimonas sedimenti]TWO71597.1 CsbD family protein [Caenimonas sedimenti]
MNKDQVKGVAKHVGGEVQEQVGKLTGDTGTQAKGHAKEMEGKAQKELGDAKEVLKDKAEDLNRKI